MEITGAGCIILTTITKNTLKSRHRVLFLFVPKTKLQVKTFFTFLTVFPEQSGSFFELLKRTNNVKFGRDR